MARVRFRAMLVTDSQTGLPRLDLAGLSGQIVEAGTTTPATITGDDELVIPGSTITISPSAFTPTFWVEDGFDEVDWLAGEIRVPIDSLTGLKQAAVAAAGAAVQALADLKAFVEAHTGLEFPAGEVPGQFLGVDLDGQKRWMSPPAGGGSGIANAPSVWPLAFPPTDHTHVPAQLTVPNLIKMLLAADTQQKARDAIGAGTGNGSSNLQLGTAADQAAPGNHAHKADAVALATAISGVTGTSVQAVLAELAGRPSGGGSTGLVIVRWSAGAYPAQPSSPPAGTLVRVAYGPVQPTYATWTGVVDQYFYADLA